MKNNSLKTLTVTLLAAGAVLAADTRPDQMKPLQSGVTVSFDLGKGESGYHQIALPAGEIKVVVDIRRRDGRSQEVLSARMTVVDGDGVPIQNFGFNVTDVDVARREVQYYRVKRPMTLGIKLTNESPAGDCRFWVTVAPNGSRFVPVEGSVEPSALTVGELAEGELDPHQSAYHRVRLPKGTYRAIADLASTNARATNLFGKALLLNADGGSPYTLTSFSEFDSSRRQAGSFELKTDATVVIRVLGGTVTPLRYGLKIVPTAE